MPTPTATPPPPHRPPPHPILYGVLMLPFGIPSGFVPIVLGWVGAQRGLKVGEVGALVAVGLLPHTFKVLWAPLTDLVWTRKRWYAAANLVCAATLVAMGLVPLERARLPLFQALVVVNSVATTFLAMAAEAIMAHGAPPEQRGKAAGWAQAGNLGGASAVGGGLGLLLWRRLPSPTLTTGLLGAFMAACMIALAFVAEPPKETGSVRARLAGTVRDLWRAVRGARGVLTLLLCALPLGAAAASGLFSAMADDWRAPPTMVEWANGWLAGGITAAGALAGGWISDALPSRKAAYCVCGAALAAIAAGMGLAPRAPWTYASFCLAYAFGSGLCYGTYTGFVLESLGGRALATQFNAFASLANFPIWYMTQLDGWAHDRWGAAAAMLMDAGAAMVGLVVFVAATGVALWRTRSARAATRPTV